MDECIDSYNNILSIEDYQKLSKAFSKPKIYCPYCKSKVFIKYQNSLKKETYFSHYPNQSCEENGLALFLKNYTSSPKSEKEINELKHLIIYNIFNIYLKVCEVTTLQIDYLTFINDFQNLIYTNILKFSYTTVESIPFFLLSTKQISNGTFYIFTTPDNHFKNSYNFNTTKSVLKEFTVCNKTINLTREISSTPLVNYHYIDYDFMNRIVTPLQSILQIRNDDYCNTVKNLLSRIR